MDHSIAIIGTGFSGLGVAIRLKQQGVTGFTLFERAGEVGGTWRDNSYPGSACDVESHLYSYSFAPNPRWSRMFSPQPEIWDYLRDCARRFGILPHIRFNHEVRSADWDDTARLWRITTSQGTHTARILIAAPGALSEPMIPTLPGLDCFRGKVMHSARWDHKYDLRDRNVAVIGTGASAIQFVPEIQRVVARLNLFQRTPPWVIPRMDRAISWAEQSLFKRFPILQRAWRQEIFLFREATGLAFRHPRLLKAVEKIAIKHMERAISDPDLRKKLTPKYRIGCKRILLSNDYYPALARKNVEVITDPIREIRESSIVTTDGRARPIDTLIFGTGFQVTEMPFARFVHGKDGRALSDVWNGSPRGHLGTTVVGYPNLFLLLGPNTGLGHNSVVEMIEAQIEHVLKAIDYMARERVAAIEPKPEAEARFNQEVDAKMRRTVWVTGGCSSWYLDRNGRNSTLWPSSIPAFRKRVEPFNPKEYHALGSAPQSH